LTIPKYYFTAKLKEPYEKNNTIDCLRLNIKMFGILGFHKPLININGIILGMLWINHNIWWLNAFVITLNLNWKPLEMNDIIRLKAFVITLHLNWKPLEMNDIIRIKAFVITLNLNWKPLEMNDIINLLLMQALIHCDK
jgi:hypothetical protein